MSLKSPSSPLGSRGEKFKISFSGITTFYGKISIYNLKESESCIGIVYKYIFSNIGSFFCISSLNAGTIIEITKNIINMTFIQ